MRRMANYLSLVALLSVQVFSLNVSALAFMGAPNCAEVFSKSAPAPKNLPPDHDAFENGKPLIDGGITPKIPIENQQCIGFCWAYGFDEYMAFLKLKADGVYVELSPELNGFYHFNFQIANHFSYFQKLAKEISSGIKSVDGAIDEFMKVRTFRPGSKMAADAGFISDGLSANGAFIPQEGSDEPTALVEAVITGVAPRAIFNRPITTQAQGAELTQALRKVVQEILTSSNRQAFFAKSASADQGINMQIYDLMVKYLMPVWNENAGGQTAPPPLPNDTFKVNADGSVNTDGTGTDITLKDFATQKMKINPADFSDIQMTVQNKALLLEAVKESLLQGLPVPMGFLVANQMAFEQSGTLSIDILKGQITIAGGHLTLVNNMKLDAQGNILGLIFQNSWGLQGLDANGAKPASPQQSGFNAITTGYIDYTLQVKEPPDFFLHESILSNPKFAALRANAVKPTMAKPRKATTPRCGTGTPQAC